MPGMSEVDGVRTRRVFFSTGSTVAEHRRTQKREHSFSRVRTSAPELGAVGTTRETSKSVIGARIRALTTRSRDEWMELIKKDWTALENAPPEIRADPEICFLALAQDKQAFLLAAPELRQDRAFVLEAIKQKPIVMRAVEPPLLDDPSFQLDAVRANNLAVHGLYVQRPERFKDSAFFLELVSITTESWWALERNNDPLANDLDLLRAALRVNQEIVSRFSEARRTDPKTADVLIEAGAWAALRHIDSPTLRKSSRLDEVQAALASGEMRRSWLPNELAVDPAFIGAILAGDRREANSADIKHALERDPAAARAAVEADPLLYRKLPRAMQQRMDPALRRRCEAVEKRLAELGFKKIADRISRFSTIEELIRNRTTPDENDPRPLAVVVFGTADWNKAFENNAIDELLKGYRVVYHEVSTEGGAINALQEATAKRAASLLIIGGHGTQGETQLGGGLFWPWQREERNLDLSDEEQLRRANIGKMVGPGAHVILESCSTGQGRDKENNMANMLHRLMPQATIHAPTEPAAVQIVLDEHGHFDRVRYDRDDIEYRVPPSSS